MDYVLTDHARKRIARRGIREEWIKAALEHPGRTENDSTDPDLAHALRPITDRGFRVLRVIYNENTTPFTIVTAYFDDTVTDL
jgi:hypothetical protein